MNSLKTLALTATLLASAAQFSHAQVDYSSLPAHGVASHAWSGLMLGATWTPEAGPGPDLDDGVVPSLLTRGADAFIDVAVNGPAIARLWIDMNANNWFDAPELLVADAPLAVAGVHRLHFTVPAFGPAGPRCARVRISNVLGLGPVGPAASGEVSDFVWWVN